MSFTGNGNMSPADLAAVCGNNNGGFGNDESWLFVLFLFALFGGAGGWGNGFGGNSAVPYMMSNTDNEVQRGFDQSAVMNGLQTLQSGNFDISQSMLNGFNSLAMAMQNCCCENRLATANLNSTILSEGCADRAAVSDGIRDILVANTANTQAIINSQTAGFKSIDDKLCQLEMDAKNDKIADLQRKLAEAQSQASQNAQTAAIIANNEAQTTALEQYLRPVANPAYIVPNPNCCSQTSYCNGCQA